MSDENLIKLILMNGAAYVWNSDDWMKLRKHRIMGNFVGSLAALPRQDFLEGLPLALLAEETTLLLDEKIAELIEISNISERPSDDSVEKFKKFKENNLAEQVEIFKELRKKEIEDKIDVILEGKMKTRRNIDPNEPLDKRKVLEDELKKIQEPNESFLSVQIFTADPWIENVECKSGVWKYPSNDKEKLFYYTFRDLWKKGYYITPGGKFGAHFLAYPGDPSRFHSHFIVICVDKKELLKPNRIISYGRLGQSVRKTVALAYLSDNDIICYQSIQWTGH